MSKIYNMVRTIGSPGSSPEVELPVGWKLSSVVYLGPTNDQEKIAGFFKVLYILEPVVAEVRNVVPNVSTEVRKAGRPKA